MVMKNTIKLLTVSLLLSVHDQMYAPFDLSSDIRIIFYGIG